MRIFYILLSTILLINTQAKSQVRPPAPDPEHKLIKFYPNPAIPDGMHTVTPHLVTEGAAEALAFYAKAFGAVSG